MSKKQEKKEEKEKGPTKPQGQLRRITIATDGVNINIEKTEISVLELCEVARRILKQYAGEQ